LGVAPGPMSPVGQAGLELTPVRTLPGADVTNSHFPHDGVDVTPSPTSPNGQIMLGVTTAEPLPDSQIEVEPIPGSPSGG